jgi:hypothetical protein
MKITVDTIVTDLMFICKFLDLRCVRSNKGYTGTGNKQYTLSIFMTPRLEFTFEEFIIADTRTLGPVIHTDNTSFSTFSAIRQVKEPAYIFSDYFYSNQDQEYQK